MGKNESKVRSLMPSVNQTLCDLFGRLLLSLTLLITACSKQENLSNASASANEPAKAKPFEGQVFRTADDRQVITLISQDELEMRGGDAGPDNLICKYTRQDDTLRVVQTILGTQRAIYYKITPYGLQANDGTVLFNSASIRYLNAPEARSVPTKGEAILNNLRQLGAAADQWNLENQHKGPEALNAVTLAHLVGPDTYIRELIPVDGEDYNKLDLRDGFSSWKIVSQSGITVVYDRAGSEAPRVLIDAQRPESSSDSQMVEILGNSVELRRVSPDELSAMGLPLLQGRIFYDHDNSSSSTVVILNQAAAELLFKPNDAIGQIIRMPGPREVIGVVGDDRASGPTGGQQSNAIIFVPRQSDVELP